MSDRDLLAKAAKAAGFGGKESAFCWTESEYPRGSDQHGALWNYIGHGDSAVLWNPLTDDGDALRLAVKLELMFDRISPGTRYMASHWVATKGDVACYEPEDYRRAIVRAAAALADAGGRDE
jgi:hypothetical protein